MRKILYGATMVLALAWISGQAAELPSLPAQAQARQPTLDDRLATERAELVRGLALTPAQQKKLEAIFVQARPRLAAVTALPAIQQAAERRKRMDDMHLRINEMLTPDQRATYEWMQARAEERRNAQAKAGNLPTAPGR